MYTPLCNWREEIKAPSAVLDIIESGYVLRLKQWLTSTILVSDTASQREHVHALECNH